MSSKKSRRVSSSSECENSDPDFQPERKRRNPGEKSKKEVADTPKPTNVEVKEPLSERFVRCRKQMMDVETKVINLFYELLVEMEKRENEDKDKLDENSPESVESVRNYINRLNSIGETIKLESATILKDFNLAFSGKGDAKPFKCTHVLQDESVCEKRYNNKFHLQRHLKLHSGPKTCDFENCGITFPDQLKLEDHVKKIHEQKKGTEPLSWHLNGTISRKVIDSAKVAKQFKPLCDLPAMGAIGYIYFAIVLHPSLAISPLIFQFSQLKDLHSVTAYQKNLRLYYFITDGKIPLDKQARQVDFDSQKGYNKYTRGHGVAKLFAGLDERFFRATFNFTNCFAQLQDVNNELESIETVVKNITCDFLQSYIFHIAILPDKLADVELLNGHTPIALAFAKVIVTANQDGNHIVCLITVKPNNLQGILQKKYETFEGLYRTMKVNMTDPFAILASHKVYLERKDFRLINFVVNPDVDGTPSLRLPIRQELISLNEESDDEEDEHFKILSQFKVSMICSNRKRCKACTKLLLRGGTDPISIRHVDDYYHLSCFAKTRSEVGLPSGGEELPGFKDLEPAHQKQVKMLLPSLPQSL